jgi:hypothetical protein
MYNPQTPPIVILSSKILENIFEYLQDKVSFVNFWIGCGSNTEIYHKAKSALLNIDFPYFLEKTRRSILTQFITFLHINLIDNEVHFDGEISYLNYVLEVQKLNPRLKRISIGGINHFSFDVSGIFTTIAKFSFLEKIVMSQNVVIKSSWLYNFKKLKMLDAPDCLIQNNYHFRPRTSGVTSVRTKYFVDFAKLFPYLTHLHLCLSWRHNTFDKHYVFNKDTYAKTSDASSAEKISDENLTVANNVQTAINAEIASTEPNIIATVDLSGLVFLEELKFCPEISHKVNVTVSSLHLKTAEIDSGVALISSDEGLKYFFPSMLKLILHVKPQVQNSSMECETFRSAGIYAPELNFFIGNNMTKGSIESINWFTSVENLELYDFEAWDFNMDAIPLDPLLSLNLKNLKLYNVNVMAFHLQTIGLLCSNVKKLVWKNVKRCTSNNMKPFAPSLSPVTNLIYLEASIESKDWLKLMPILVTIQCLNLTNYETLVQIGMSGLDAVSKCHFYSRAMNSDEFVVRFHMERINKVIRLKTYSSLQNYNLCRNLIIEDRVVNRMYGEPTRAWCQTLPLDTHNATLIKLFGFDDPKINLNFIYRMSTY